MSPDIITRNLIHSTPTRMTLRGGVQTNNNVIPAIAKELREFLSQHRGNHIGKEELEEFYRRYFPQAKLNIIDGRPSLGKSSKARAACSVEYTDDMKDIEEFQIHIQSKTFMDKIKFLFAIPNNKKPFYVDNEFIQVFIHEYTHFMQRYLKPIDKTTQISISSHTSDLSSKFIQVINNDIHMTDKNIVYKVENRDFSPEVFRTKLMEQLYKPYYSTDTIVIDELKFLIRHAQAERQAHQIDMEESSWARHPKLMKNKRIRAIIREFNKKILDRHFRFDEKIRVMKEEYLRLINQERATV